MSNVKLIIEYDGSDFCGWQKQPSVPTVQGTLEDALSSVLNEKITVTGCSRTDTGVHAVNYCANFFTSSSVPADRICLAVRHALPSGILVKSSETVPDCFHACFSAKSKTYRYYFSSSPVTHPLFASRVWQINAPLSLAAMSEAAEHYKGTHRFDAFRNADPYSDRKNTEKTIFDAKVFNPFPEHDNLFCFEVTGSGFLYNMVRIMTGTLVYVGEGKILPSDIDCIIASGDRTNAGITAPPEGLYLFKVEY